MNIYLKWTPSPKIAAARNGENEYMSSTYRAFTQGTSLNSHKKPWVRIINPSFHMVEVTSPKLHIAQSDTGGTGSPKS